MTSNCLTNWLELLVLPCRGLPVTLINVLLNIFAVIQTKPPREATDLIGRNWIGKPHGPEGWATCHSGLAPRQLMLSATIMAGLPPSSICHWLYCGHLLLSSLGHLYSYELAASPLIDTVFRPCQPAQIVVAMSANPRLVGPCYIGTLIRTAFYGITCMQTWVPFIAKHIIVIKHAFLDRFFYYVQLAPRFSCSFISLACLCSSYENDPLCMKIFVSQPPNIIQWSCTIHSR